MMFGLILLVSCIPHRPSPTLISSERQSIELPQNTSSENIIRHFAYTVSFNPQIHLPNWVAHELTAYETDGPWARKGLRFMPDPDCLGEQADREDYRNSGYSHGHLAPAGDMKWDSLAMIESFYYTNCIPQDANLNTGKWHQLEEKTRKLAKEYGSVYVVTGPVIQYDSVEKNGYHGIASRDCRNGSL
jgi:endonuclease G